ncbi:ALF repeat-containing protein [Kitasatospora sp. NPDC054939]
MKIRRSLAAAVLLATAAAPVALGAPALADTAPAGQEQNDPAGARTDEENRAAIERLLVYPNDYLVTAPSRYLREHAAKALAGTPEDRARFLASEVDRIRRDDARVAIVQIMNGGGPAMQKAGEAAFRSDDLAVFRAFLTTGRHVARAEDENRAELRRILDDPNTGPGVREGAQKALAGTAAEVEHFLKVGIKNPAEHDDRVRLMQILSLGGPAVRKAADAAMNGTHEDVRAFLRTGQHIARAEDEKRAEVRRIADAAGTGRHVREAAEKALAGSVADVERFLASELEPLRASDDRIHASRIVETGGPEVRRAGSAALDGTIADVRAFLKEGQFTARAKDQAAAKAAAEAASRNATTTGGSSTGAVAVTSTTTGTKTTATAVTATADAQRTGGTLAATGSTTPHAGLAAVAGAAVVLGAGAVAASRRRSQA